MDAHDLSEQETVVQTSPATHDLPVQEETTQHTEKGDREKESRGTTTSSSSGDSVDPKDAVLDLARAVTYQSLKDSNGQYVNPFLGSADNPSLDPHSGKFNAYAWTKALLAVESRDPELYPKRTAGVAYSDLSVHGFGQPTDYQKTFGNYPLEAGSLLRGLIGKKQQTKIQILRNFDGLVRSGEMLVVLGRPGSGCSTLLKTIAGETDGFFVDEASQINYQGIPVSQMHKDFRGECIYQAEVDVHFPQMTVGQTLGFAARARGTSRCAVPSAQMGAPSIIELIFTSSSQSASGCQQRSIC
jgi:ATP-binding cassette subfamily G (WHITE) protein 2 (PDR)